jgi:hypothetical protein
VAMVVEMLRCDSGFLETKPDRKLVLQKTLRVAARLLHKGSRTYQECIFLLICPANCGISGVGLPGLEPGTSSLSEKRSNRLSYRP